MKVIQKYPQKIWAKICYIDGITRSRFDYSTKKKLADMVSEFRNKGWDDNMIYEFLESEVELSAKTVDYCTSLLGYIYGWKNYDK